MANNMRDLQVEGQYMIGSDNGTARAVAVDSDGRVLISGGGGGGDSDPIPVVSKRLVVTESHQETGTQTFNVVSDSAQAIDLINDSNQALVLAVNGLSTTINPMETYSGEFEDFTQFTVTGVGAYRVQVRTLL